MERFSHSDQVINGQVVPAPVDGFIDALETRDTRSSCWVLETPSFRQKGPPGLTTKEVEMPAKWALWLRYATISFLDPNPADTRLTAFRLREPVPPLGARFTIIFAPRPMTPSKRHLDELQTPWRLPFPVSVFRDLREVLGIDGAVIDYVDGFAFRRTPLSGLAAGEILKIDLRTPIIANMPWSHTAISLSYNPRTRETNVVVFGCWRDLDGTDMTRNIYQEMAEADAPFHPFDALMPFLYSELTRCSQAVCRWDDAVVALAASAREVRDTPLAARRFPAYRQACETHRSSCLHYSLTATALQRTLLSWLGMLECIAEATRELADVQRSRAPGESREFHEQARQRDVHMTMEADRILEELDRFTSLLEKYGLSMMRGAEEWEDLSDD